MLKNVERKSSPIRHDDGSTGGIAEHLRRDLLRPEFSEGYAESFHDAYIATQIKVLREQHNLTQTKLAEMLNTTQTVISRIENVNYSAWNITTLKKLARAFRVRLKVSFETYGSIICDMEDFSRENLRRTPRENDPDLIGIRQGAQLTLVGGGAEKQAESDVTQNRTAQAIYDNLNRRPAASESMYSASAMLSGGAMKVAISG